MIFNISMRPTDSLFEVVLKKSSRGLGLSVVGGVERPGPLCGLVRISRLHPQLPAALSQSLLLGDVLLEANRTSLAGLSCHVSVFLSCHVSVFSCVKTKPTVGRCVVGGE